MLALKELLSTVKPDVVFLQETMLDHVRAKYFFLKVCPTCMELCCDNQLDFQGGYNLARWSLIAKPKNKGGWGIRDLNLFNKALASKSLWRALFHDGIWSVTMRRKYLKGVDVVSWLRSKKHFAFQIASIIWKNILTTLLVVKRWIAWKVGTGTRVLLGLDPFLGGGSGFILSKELLPHLQSRSLYYLAYIHKTNISNLTGSSI